MAHLLGSFCRKLGLGTIVSVREGGNIAGRRRRGIRVRPAGSVTLRHGALPGRISNLSDHDESNADSRASSQDSNVSARLVAPSSDQNQEQAQDQASGRAPYTPEGLARRHGAIAEAELDTSTFHIPGSEARNPASRPSEPTRLNPNPIPSDQLADLLRMPTAASSAHTSNVESNSTPTTPSRTIGEGSRPQAETRPKAPRLKGVRVEVETHWFIEAVVALWSRLAGVILYTVVTLSLPTLSPTSAPPLLSLLALRTELGALTTVWSTARGRVECLEFVERRWGSNSNALKKSEAKVNDASSSIIAADVESVDSKSYSSQNISVSRNSQRCPICFEQVDLYELPFSSKRRLKGDASNIDSADEAERVLDSIYSRSDKPEGAQLKLNPKACKLDCGHLLHSMCLVDWLSHQAFCPTCHDKLKATPPSSSVSTATIPGLIRSSANGPTLREAMIRATGRENFAER